MRFLADANFPGPAVRALRDEGHDVAWILEDSPRLPDTDVLARAQEEERVLLTLDKDFGDLVFLKGLEASAGVILFRFGSRNPSHFVPLIIATIQSRQDWAGHFSVVDERGVRSERLISQSDGSPPP